MEINAFLGFKNFKHYENGFEQIKEDFVQSGYERLLWRSSLEEFNSREITSKLITDSLQGRKVNPYVKAFLDQFNKVSDTKCVFIFPERISSNYFMTKDILEKNGAEIKVLENIFPDDDTINYIGIIDQQNKSAINLLFHVVYSGVLDENFGGYKLYGRDISYYDQFCASQDLIYSLQYTPETANTFNFNGYATRKDTNPFIIYFVRKMIEKLVEEKKFESEFEIYQSMVLDLMPFLEGVYQTTKSIAESSCYNWKEKKQELYSRLVANGTINTRWRNKASLYGLVRKLYPDAIYQYHSKWLGQQSLDIYILSKRIGIEYQGVQHYQAVEHFGGEENHQRQVVRDKIKHEKCKDNGVTLIEWNYNYDVTDENVKKMLSKLP